MMKIFQYTIVFLVAILGVTVVPFISSWQGIDVYLVVLLAALGLTNTRTALPVAIFFGLVSDLFAATPFGTFLVIFPVTLGVIHAANLYVLTNYSFGAMVARVALATVFLHVAIALVRIAAIFLSRDPGYATALNVPFLHMTLIAIMWNIGATIVGVYIYQRLVRRYESRFLRRQRIV